MVSVGAPCSSYRRARVALLAGFLVLVALATGAALRGDGPSPGDPLVPGTDEAARLPGPLRLRPRSRGELIRRAMAGSSHILYARSPEGAAATAARVARYREPVEDAADAGRGRRGPARGRSSSSRAPGGRTRWPATRGRGGAHADPGRDGPEPPRHAGRRRRSSRLTRRIGRRERHGRERRAAARRAPGGRRALRPREGARRHRALPDVRAARSSAARTSRSSRTTWASATSRRAASVRRGDGRPTRASTSTPRRRAARRHPHARCASATTRPTTSGRWTRPRRSCASTATTRRSSQRHAGAPGREELRRGGAASAGLDAAVRRPGRAAPGLRGRHGPAFPDDPARTGLGATRGWASSPAGWTSTARSTGAGPQALAMALYIGAQVRAYAGGDAALIVTSTVRDAAYQELLVAPEPRGHARLLPAHDRLGVRHRAGLPRPPPRRGVPVRARPAPGAQRDRVGPRARRDPHHRVHRGGEAAAAARADRPEGARRSRAPARRAGALAAARAS